MECFICEKQPGLDAPFRAVFGPLSTRSEAETWLQLRINYTENMHQSRVIQIFGKSELIRRFYSRSYSAVMLDVESYHAQWLEMAESVIDLGLHGEYYDTLIEWYHDQE